MTVSLRAIFALLLFQFAAFGQLEQFGFGSEKADQVTASLVADTTAIVPGQEFTVLVRLEMKEGWHVYWQFGGDAGTPPKVTWTLPEGFTAGAIEWPIPKNHVDEGDLLTYIYEPTALLPVKIRPPAQLSAKEVTLVAKVSWLVCEKICIPGAGEVSLTLPVGTEATAANAILFADARSRLPKNEPPPFQAKWDVKADAFTVTLTGLPKESRVEFFPLPPSGVKPGAAKVGDPDANGVRTVSVPVKRGGASDTPWQALVVAKLGDGPRSGWTITSAGSTGVDVGMSPSLAGAPKPGVPQNLFALLFWGFIGGLILNLMPCVLPVIALKIFGFVSQAGEDPKRIFHLGLAFTAGVYVFFLALAILAIVLGKNFYWGAQFAEPRIFLILVSLVVIFALSMFGVFEITLGGTVENTLGSLSRKDGYGGAFGHGLFTTLLGTSCTAPFLATVLGVATTQPPVAVILIFMAIAAGMSLPYLLLTWKPAWLRYLPKPGVWMERFKQLTGFILLSVAVFLLNAFGTTRGTEPMAAALWLLLFVSLATWIYGVGHRRWWAIVLALLTIGIGAKLFLADAMKKTKGAPIEAVADERGITWEPFSVNRIEEARSKNIPVFIDFTAEWCVNCKANKKFVLNTSAVAGAFKDKNVLTIKADWSDFDKEIGQWINKFGRIGVPVYVLYRPGEAEPVVFPEVLTQARVIEELAKIKAVP